MNEMILWSPGVTVAAIEKMVILKALQHFRYNKTLTAKSLGIAVKTLSNKLELYEHESKLEQERQVKSLNDRKEFLARQRGNLPDHIGIPHTKAEMVSAIVNAAQEETKKK